MQSEQTAELAAALAKAQAAMQSAKFDKTNPHFKNKYASLAAVIDAIRKPLADNGLSYTQATEIREGGFVLVTTLRHASGQWVASEYPLPQAAKPQELGSALTYARRYSLSALACIAADEDDDAEAAQAGGQTATIPKARNGVKPQPIEPPVNPETGEVSPHKITAADPMAWGASFVAAIKSSGSEAELDKWLSENKEAMDTLESAAPKIYDRVKANIDDKRGSFNKAAA